MNKEQTDLINSISSKTHKPNSFYDQILLYFHHINLGLEKPLTWKQKLVIVFQVLRSD